jgi:hypothetical protein
MSSFLSAIARKLQNEQDELDAAEEITKKVFPATDKLTRNDMLNSVSLKARLAKMDKEYRDVVYGLCRIAVDGGPEGSVIVLDPKKVLAIIDDIEEEMGEEKPDKKTIFGITKKIIKAIKGITVGKLAVLCYLINDLVIKKVINVPSPHGLKAAAGKIKSLVGGRAGKSSGRG